jgi:orotidine-5'-phosphate decarboxylase
MDLLPHRRIVLPLDVPTALEAIDTAAKLREHVGVVKVGLQLFTAVGPSILEVGPEYGIDVFLDLKLHDIPNTVERAARNAARLGVAMLTVNASGGGAMLRAAVTGAASAERPPAVLAVTVLTSLDDAALDSLGIGGGAAGRVSAWASLAKMCGCGGVVCSPQEASRLRAAFGPGFKLVTPGVRPAGEATGDQRRVATPREAIAAGADLLVVGRPITAAPDPAAAAESILAEICKV